jgi:hypothetical protein
MERREVRERRLDLVCRGGFQNAELHSFRPCCFLRVGDRRFVGRVLRVDQQADHPGLRHQLGKQFDPLLRQLAEQDADAGQVAARPGKAGDQTLLDRIADIGEDDRDGRCGVLRRQSRGVPPPATITSTSRAARSRAMAGIRS